MNVAKRYGIASALVDVFLWSALLSNSAAVRAEPAAGGPAAIAVTAFTPQGQIKGVRQVVARFSAPVVNFGDPRTDAPFDIDCPATGHGRWSDTNVWIYDFDADLPGAVQCRFRIRAGAIARSGAPLQPAAFAFDTGGPAILASYPHEGYESIDEAQVFLLALDTPADPASVRAHAYCDVAGVGERVPVEALEGKARDALIDAVAGRAYNLFAVLTKRGFLGVLGMKDPHFRKAPLVALRCARPLPPGARVNLVWGTGIRAAVQQAGTALATGTSQSLPFAVRSEFTARQSCERANEKAGCVPVLPIEVGFSAPVRLDTALQMELRTAAGTILHPEKPRNGRGTGTAKDATVQSVRFAGPFAAKSRVVISLPKGFADDAGRTLANAKLFPLAIDIDDDPPLVKVGSPFGILEAHADPVLPVSVRNIEASLAGWHLEMNHAPAGFPVRGSALRVNATDDTILAHWMKRLLAGPARESGDYSARPGELPLLTPEESSRAQPVALPVPDASQALQLIGVPLNDKGLHVLQFASNRLGAVLHGEQRPYYVYSGALVTNLGVHFKRGRESSLAWVTQLDNARPVANAHVQVDDCTGHVLWAGQTDGEGIARIDKELPQDFRWRECPHAPTALMVTARAGDDMSLMLTNWSEGLDTWQFNMAGGVSAGPIAAHTVTDRPLFRAGETVSMKHFLRRRSGNGFAAIDAHALPRTVQITHLGSQERYELDLAWHDGTALSTWKIPAEAKSGEYAIALTGAGIALSSGEFRVEQFRVPLMRAVLRPPAEAVVRKPSVDITAQLSYLSGGPAAGQPVKFRSRVVPHTLSFAQYDDFHFDGDVPREGLSSTTPAWMNDSESEDETPDEGAAPGPAAVATQTVSLDASGGASVHFDRLPMPGVGTQSAAPQSLEVEMEYADPNGQILTAGTSVPLLAARIALGMKVEGYFATREKLAFKVLALDMEGKPQAGRAVEVQAYQRTRYAYRKRLLGGFYAYEQSTEVRKLGPACSGRTDARGLLVCDGAAPAAGELILVAQARDAQDNIATASLETYVAGGDDDWFEAGASDRIDLLPDRRAYEPGETARFEVRMPFRHATALVTVEREGVLAHKVVELDATAPL